MENRVSTTNLGWYHGVKNQPQSYQGSEVKPKKERKDILLQYPVRALAYTNEIGEALRPIPGIGNKIANLLYVPALLYIGADVWDKYLRGRNNDYERASRRTAVKQAVFQGLASVALPTLVVHASQRFSMKACKALRNFACQRNMVKLTSVLTNLMNKPTKLKLIAGFAALGLAAIPIDHFVDRFVIKKVLDPQLDRIDEKLKAKKLKQDPR